MGADGHVHIYDRQKLFEMVAFMDQAAYITSWEVWT